MGKSTLLQAIAISLVGPLAGQRLLLNPDGWARQGRRSGEFSAEVVKGEGDTAAGQPRKKPYSTRFAVTGREEVTVGGSKYDRPQLVHVSEPATRKGLMAGPYASRKPGWVSCGYGPFRRLLGGASEVSELMFWMERESRFVTLFRRQRP